jgi:hypothetical protein
MGADMINCGRVWALLALARLHLAVPPASADPAGKYGMLRQHLLQKLATHYVPELGVRKQVDLLPGRPCMPRRLDVRFRRGWDVHF